jgi:alpha-ketoglutarate-dependent 2,4-dichlorophenoxyacetate dioxygenase
MLAPRFSISTRAAASRNFDCIMEPIMSDTLVRESFVTEIRGLPRDLAAFRRTMDRYAVCVIRSEKPLPDAEHVEFSRKLGPLLPMKMLTMVGRSKSRFAFPEIIDIGNIDAEGRILPEDDRRRAYNRGNLLWHTDASYDQRRGVYSLLSCHSVPPGGADTEFADMRAAYESLPEAMKSRIEPLVAEHSIWHSRALAGMSDVTDAEQATRPPARHRLVQQHGGRKLLYIASHASHILGMPLEEGRRLIRELIELATRAQFVYRHKWRVGDLVVWDNRQTMHRGTPFDDTRYPRDMRRTTVIEEAAA